jgi:hypothetical protein
VVVFKPDAESLGQFIRRNGGINACAARFSRFYVASLFEDINLK